MAKRTASAAISRMPAKVQDAVSRCLADGGTWRDVAALCDASGYPGVTPQNVTNYRKGAHREWLARQERLAQAQAAYSWKIDLLNKYKEDGGPAEAGIAAAMDMLESALADMDAGDIKGLIADKPGKIFDLMKMLINFRRELADIRREDREAAAEGNAGKPVKTGLTAEDCARIEKAMNLI